MNFYPAKSKMHSKISIFLLISFLIFILFLSFSPESGYPTISNPVTTHTAHFILFAGLGYIAALTFGTCPVRWYKTRFWLFLVLFTLAYWIEFLKSYIVFNNQAFSYKDVLANGTGIAIGIFFRIQTSSKNCHCAFSSSLTHPIGTKSGYHPIGGIELIGNNPCIPNIIGQTFHWKPVSIQKNGLVIRAICTGKEIVSLPHLSYGNIWIQKSTTVQSVEDRLSGYMDHSPFPSIELRYLSPDSSSGSSEKIITCKNVEHKNPIHFRSNLRRKINKAKNNGFYIESGGLELLDEFYKIYTAHLRTLGSASLSRKWFRELLTHYTGGFCGIFLLKKNRHTVGAALNLEYHGFYENCYVAVLKPFQQDYGSYALFEIMIQHARQLNCQIFSFGRSIKGSGVHQFKRQWDTFDIPLIWLRSDKLSINPRKHRWVLGIWKKVPYFIKKLVNHYIAKWIY
ncbi:MAG: peptidoglycan bridge formation glycyltransferase FemA/FemB family protein [Bacteroidales bacterium]|nr:peptidoglycan bridge formation glycyltransferase FemA/FemB family protein [Bacteroidales bacterium]